MKKKKIFFLYTVILSILSVFELFTPLKAYSIEEKIILSDKNNDMIFVEKGRFMNSDKQDSNNTSPSIKQESVTGTVSYRERIALPSGAVIKLKLLDVSRQDAPAIEISSQTITTSGEQVPINFELTFDPSKIENSHSYTIRAEIFISDNLSFTTTRNYSVITRGNGSDVDLVLEKVKTTSLESQLIGTEWLLEDLLGKGVIDRLQTTLLFGKDNRIGGNGGCNQYFGSYQMNDQTLTLSGIGSTFKMCSPAIMNQESQYLQALEKAKTIRLEGPYLFIDCEGFDQPLKFTRLVNK